MHRIPSSRSPQQPWSMGSTCMYVVRMGYTTIKMFLRKEKNAKVELGFFDKPIYKSAYACCQGWGLDRFIDGSDYIYEY